ncbi:MAG TPA: tetratricopeptide repeat protein [Burkholderiales bacterium]|nr:tetratricopeptide repeat protein [Burkholderiales bacterium]
MQAAWDALERNDFRFAERAARAALARSPSDPEALYLLGSTLLFEGRFAEARDPLEAAAARLSRRGVRYRLGHCYLALGDPAQAERVLRAEAEEHPQFANAHNTLGVALVHQAKNEAALAAFRAVLELEPAHAEANANAAHLLFTLGRPEEALPLAARAIEANPELADAHLHHGLILHALKRYEEAVASFARAYRSAPDTPYALSSLVWSALHCCDWRTLGAHTGALREQVRAARVPAAPFTLVAVSDSHAEQLQCAARHVRESLPARPPLRRAEPQAAGRIRLAYLSADFHEHATAYLAARLFELHDPQRFELIGVSYGPDDGSATRARLARAFHFFIDAREMSDQAAARLLAELEPAIAVDLKGHTAHARLGILAYRPAAVQVTYLGYPGTSAAPFIDYVIADRVVIRPEDEAFYTEKIAYLPHSYQVNDDSVAIDAAPAREALGLPAGAFVFCCLNAAYKVMPQVFDTWMRLLAQVPASVLWLFDHGPAATRNLRAAARERGIDPQRLVFAPRVEHAQHLARQRHADLFLDTLPYNAHTTASDALWAGLPLVTCLGSTFAGRVAASLLGALGLVELVTTSLADYEALALALARDPRRLAAVRDKLGRNLRSAPLFDSARFCRDLERAYLRMWELHRRGEPPRSFEV